MEEKTRFKLGKRKISKRLLFGFALLSMIVIATAVSTHYWNLSQEECVACSDSERTLRSITKIDSNPLYYIELWGDYGFEQHLETDIDAWVDEREGNVNTESWMCTCFTTLNNNSDFLFGRNFDWYDGLKALVYTNASDAYASYSMVDLDLMGFTSEQDFLEASHEDYLQAAYWPMDGMNEHGLSIGCMTAGGSENIMDPNKTTLGSLSFMRLALDYAKTVNETVALWNNYNVYFPTGPPLHYLVGDALGNSAIIEFTDGAMQVITTQNSWQVSTNFLLYGSTPTDQSNCWRFVLAEGVMEENNGQLTTQEAMNLLEDVAQEWSTGATQWSNVYNMNTKEISIVVNMKYRRSYLEYSF